MEGPLLTKEQREGIRIVSGTAHRELALATAKLLTPDDYEGKPLDDVDIHPFLNTEQYVRYLESIREQRLFIIQSMVPHILSGGVHETVDTALMQTLLLVDAGRRASASEINVVSPVLGYMRQDRKNEGREPISGGLVLDLLHTAGADRVMTMDMHSDQLEAAWRGPFDRVPIRPVLIDEVRKLIGDQLDDYVIVAPDAGAVRNAEIYGEKLNVEVTWVSKQRDRKDSSLITRKPAQEELVRGRHCVVVDDMIDSGKTLITVVHALKAASALSITVVATHGLFSKSADKLIAGAPIDKVIVTNTAPQKEVERTLRDRLTVVDTAPAFARAIMNVVTRGSISGMYEG